MNLRDQAIQIKYPETDLDVQITYYSTYKNTLIRDRVIHEFHHFVCFCQTEIKNKPKEQFAIILFFKKKKLNSTVFWQHIQYRNSTYFA